MNRGDMDALALDLKGEDHTKLTLTIFNTEVSKTSIDISINRKDGKKHNQHIDCMVTNRDNLRQFAQDIISGLDVLENTSGS